MNSIDIRTEKSNAIFRYRSFQRITTLLRFIEICVFLVVISTFSSQLPLTVRVSADYFRGNSFAGVSPMFVFVIGNVIVLILLFKSRVNENGDPHGKIDVYDEYVKRCEKSVVNRTTDIVKNPKRKICRSQSEKMMSVDYGDSQSRRKLMRSVTEQKKLQNIVDSPEICRQSENLMRSECNESESRRKPTLYIDSPEIFRNKSENLISHRKLTQSVTERKTLKNVDSPEICMSQSENVTSGRKLSRSITERKLLKNVDCCGGEKHPPEIYRSQSEKVMKVECNESQSHRKLRRSVTDCCDGETPAAEESCEVDELSSEAFRRTVEAFIAKQQQSLRDEELAPVVPYVCV